MTLVKSMNWTALIIAIVGSGFIVAPTMVYFFIPNGLLSMFWAWLITVVIGMFLYVFYQGKDNV